MVSSLQSLEREEEAASLLQDLTRLLLQPLNLLLLPRSIRPKMQVVLIMQPEGRKEKEKKTMEEEEAPWGSGDASWFP